MGGRRDNNGLGIIGTIALSILAPIAAMLVQMAISRGREYEADGSGAEICGNPHWLARALAKISQGAAMIPNETAEANPAMAHMFIVNPLSGHGMDNLVSTHPNVENRIAALEELALRMNVSDRGNDFGFGDSRQSSPSGSFLNGPGLTSNAWGSRPDPASRHDSDTPRGPWG